MYRGKYSGKRGLGPTRLISPLITFHNSGSSSKLKCLKKFPSGVKRFSSGSIFPRSSFASVMVLNLYMVNSFPFNPGLACLNIIGGPIVSNIKNAITSIKGDNKSKPISAAEKSNILFNIYFTNSLSPLESKLHQYNQSSITVRN